MSWISSKCHERSTKNDAHVEIGGYKKETDLASTDMTPMSPMLISIEVGRQKKKKKKENLISLEHKHDAHVAHVGVTLGPQRRLGNHVSGRRGL
jgi:hypothetical protein